jgi:hypothetical protein
MPLKEVRAKKLLKISFNFDIEVWFTGGHKRKDLMVAVYEDGNEVCNRTLTYSDLWELIDDNEFWEAEEREEVKQHIIARMRKFISKLEADKEPKEL